VNLLVVSLDSVRLDFVSRTAAMVDTPRFDAATAGFRFAERCFSVATATRPVHLSAFSGLYPFEHGIEGQRQGRQREKIPLLFRTLAAAGYAVGAYSEAATVFTGMDLGAPLAPLAPEAPGGLEQLLPWIRRRRREPVCLFAHYWEAHTPYGAADGLALGETLDLLRAGRQDVVRQRYIGAVERLLERKVAPLIEACDLERWCVLVFSDHGESWDELEPFHGETLRNSVLRVPLYLHAPFTGTAPFPCPVQSLVDVYPTLCALLQVTPAGTTSGRDWGAPEPDPLYVAQITPTGAAPAGVDPDLARAPADAAARQWAVFDRHWKYRWTEGSAGVLESTLAGQAEPAAPDDGRVAGLLEKWRALRAASPYAQQPLADAQSIDQGLLDQRLRDLGYL